MVFIGRFCRQIKTMTGFPRLFSPFVVLAVLGAFALGLGGCRTAPAPVVAKPVPPAPLPPAPTVVPPAPLPPAPPAPPPVVFPVMLGIDVLEANHFNVVTGKRIGLLTHPAGVNRRGVSTVDVLFHAPGVKLVELFAPEHGLRGDLKAGENFGDSVDPVTKLPVYSLLGIRNRPSKEELRGLDALVIDLQDIGVRSYTFNVTMRYAMEACFENNVEVIVLDRPNPLGGLKVDGPLLDKEWFSGVGAFRIPYVHGLTMGELAYMAASEPGALAVSDSVRTKGRLTIVPMRGWRRDMRWPETGLTFVPTSPRVRDFATVIGYAMIGPGCEFSGFTSGLGDLVPFRGLGYKGVTADKLAADLTALHIPGVAFDVVAPPGTGPVKTGVYVRISDWDAWNPTEVSFELMRLACRYNPPNPFAKLSTANARSFNIIVGSTAWWTALKRDGVKVNVETFVAGWKRQAADYQAKTKKYWLYR